MRRTALEINLDSSTESSGILARIPENQTVIIGRSPEDADLVVSTDSGISAVHFEIRCSGNRCHARDLDSHNGTILNGARVEEANLSDGDELWAGRTRFIVRSLTVADPAPEPSQTAQPSSELHSLPTITGYEILDELGRGTNGVVYRAIQVGLNRTVALKMVLTRVQSQHEEFERFSREAMVLARQQHPNIVQVYEVGEHQGQPYLALELVEGSVLSRKLAHTPQPIDSTVKLVRELALAIHYAHQRGVVHRDLKPANVLLTPDGVPKIADFGMAKLLDEEAVTATGAIIGTPSYMAPEQAMGHSRNVTPATDVHALGAILFEMLTARPPFWGDTVFDTLARVRSLTPTAPSLLRNSVPRDLDAICLRCLAKKPEDRYTSAEALADDLQKFADGESISARPPSVGGLILSALARTDQRQDFQGWARPVWSFAGIALLGELAALLIILWGFSNPLGWLVLVRVAQFASIGCVILYFRRTIPLLERRAERQMMATCTGFFLSCFAAAAVAWASAGRLDPLTVYPMWALLSGMAFFVLGSRYWGVCHVMATAFLGSAVLMMFDLRWAAVAFGMLWTSSLLAIGMRLRKLNAEPK